MRWYVGFNIFTEGEGGPRADLKYRSLFHRFCCPCGHKSHRGYKGNSGHRVHMGHRGLMGTQGPQRPQWTRGIHGPQATQGQ